MLHVRRHPDAAAFLDHAEAWLLQAEAEHNLLLGLAHQLTASTEGYEPPIYLATVEGDDGVAGCVFRTPPFKLGLTRMPEEALPVVVEDAATVYDVLPAVLGPEAEARRFAALWSERRGVQARPGMRQRIYQLEEVVPPEPWPPGRLRMAGPDDVEVVVDWFAAFAEEAEVPAHTGRERIEERVAQGAIGLWEDGQPVCMAGQAGYTPNGVRVGPVYTPPGLRRRGYGTACTAALSQHLLDAGRRFCFLYTNRANPTSNSIYQRIGYRPICDVMDVDFVEKTEPN